MLSLQGGKEMLNNSLIKINIVKEKLLGNENKNGIIKSIFIYMVLTFVGFVYLYPFIYMLITSFKPLDDLIDPMVNWIPTYISLKSYSDAFEALNFLKSFFNSFIMSFGPALLQTISVSLIGFGLARFDINLKKLWLALIVASFIIPTHVLSTPRYVLFYNYGMVDTIFPSYIQAALGQGIKSSLFILVFFQLFRNQPSSICEASEIDGCGKYRYFGKIALPMASSGIVLSFLFSFVWYWNETTESSLIFGNKIATLPMQLERFAAKYATLSGGTEKINIAVSMAGTCLSLLPIIILYAVLQKQFVTSIERTGITGE